MKRWFKENTWALWLGLGLRYFNISISSESLVFVVVLILLLLWWNESDTTYMEWYNIKDKKPEKGMCLVARTCGGVAQAYYNPQDDLFYEPWGSVWLKHKQPTYWTTYKLPDPFMEKVRT